DVTSIRHRYFLEKPHRVSISRRESRRSIGFSDLESPFRRTAQPALAKSTGRRGLKNPNRLAAILVGHLEMHHGVRIDPLHFHEDAGEFDRLVKIVLSLNCV